LELQVLENTAKAGLEHLVFEQSFFWHKLHKYNDEDGEYEKADLDKVSQSIVGLIVGGLQREVSRLQVYHAGDG
jgi:hypothetical protein